MRSLVRGLVVSLIAALPAVALGRYDIVALSFLPDGKLEYDATCGDGYAFTVRYDPAHETYRLTLGEMFATFDLAAERACRREQRTVPSDYVAAGRSETSW